MEREPEPGMAGVGAVRAARVGTAPTDLCVRAQDWRERGTHDPRGTQPLAQRGGGGSALLVAPTVRKLP